MTTEPLITIGMMAHNNGQYLAGAIESVLAQTVGDFELIIADDASLDETPAVIRPYVGDSRVKYYRHEANIGQARNWRFVLEHASAPVFARLEAHAAGADLYRGRWIRIVEGQDRAEPGPKVVARSCSGADAYGEQVRHNTVLPGAMSYRTELVRRVGYPVDELRYMVDYEYALRLLALAEQVVSTDQLLLRYRVHAGNLTAQAQTALGYVAERPILYAACQRHATLNPAVARWLPVLWRALCQEDFSDGLSEAVRRDRMRGYAIMRDAVLRCPEIAQDPKVRIDLWLFRLGLPGYRILRLLHWRRLRA